MSDYEITLELHGVPSCKAGDYVELLGQTMRVVDVDGYHLTARSLRWHERAALRLQDEMRARGWL